MSVDRAVGADRGQLVLVAAAAIALALFPMALAYLQLGYAGDVTGPAASDEPSADLDRALHRAAHAATEDVAGEYQWEAREAAVIAYKDALADDLDDLETARVEDGIGAEIEYAHAAAQEAAAVSCPTGENRAFGNCEAIDGIVVQERTGETVVVAVAFDVRVTRQDGVTTLKVILEVSG